MKSHALESAYFTFMENGKQVEVHYYRCRCGYTYFRKSDWGYAKRAEARHMHREHLKEVEVL